MSQARNRIKSSSGSRYNSEYEELGQIGKGSYGRVFKARNKLEKQEYAIKKIYPKNKSHSKTVFDEIRVLASLEHENIVSYRGSWIELHQTDRKPKDLYNIDENSVTDSLGFDYQVEDEIQQLQSQLNSLSFSLSRKKSGLESFGSETELSRLRGRYQSSTTGEETTSDERRGSWQSNGSEILSDNDIPFANVKLFYIQMKLCDCTLKGWMMKRNQQISGRIIIGSLHFDIFRQILSGVEYIHSKNIIHRDLKPSNIFFMYDVNRQICVKIGDFGLAVENETNTNSHTPVEGAGTQMYASPEQMKGLSYDSKSDMYSLGIILFELFHPFSYYTAMEYNKVIENLKRGILPDDMKEWRTQSDIIKQLLSKNPSERPSAFSLLADHFLTKDQIIENLYEQLDLKREEISLLKKQQLKKLDRQYEVSSFYKQNYHFLLEYVNNNRSIFSGLVRLYGLEERSLFSKQLKQMK